MNRGIRTLLVVAIAVTVATLATLAVYRAVQRIPVREVELAGVPVVVAVKDLPIGTMLTPADLTVAIWPARSPLAGGFGSVEELVNRGLIADMVANEPVINAKLAPANSGAGLPPTIPAGMRAISVQVNEVVGVAGFVTPGNHVDVVATISRQDNSMSRVVVSNVKVLAAGTKLDQQRAQNGEPIQTTVVTLLVTPSDGERIALASVEGRLHLTLRNPLDAEETTTNGVRVAALLGSAEPPAVAKAVRTGPARAAAPPPAPPSPAPVVSSIYTVEAIRAAKRTEEVVK
jgi:pilus assembly protein CpaB